MSGLNPRSVIGELASLFACAMLFQNKRRLITSKSTAIFATRPKSTAAITKMSTRLSDRRISADLVRLFQSKHDVVPLNDNRDFRVKFEGPKDTLYEGGVWHLRLHLDREYPFKSPGVGFMNRIFHPNIDVYTGAICLNVLSEAWSPVYDLNIIVDTFIPQLLAYPNPNDPLNRTAASLMLFKPDRYKQVVRDYITKFATEEVLRDGDPLLGPLSDSEYDSEH